MALGTAPETLSRLALSAGLAEADLAQRLHRVREHLFAHSPDLHHPDFRRIRISDLALLFDAYDREFFDGLCRATVDGRKLDFRLSRRMTSSAGATKRVRFTHGETTFEIAIAAGMLFEGFGPDDRLTAVCGIPCPTRLDALQRIFEHELVHLVEILCWERSNCSGTRFQQIAAHRFGHRSHTHNLITRRERAAEKGIRPGTRVAFTFEGRRLTGRVHRITKRATVLVEHPQGELYSNGLRYLRYYVPIHGLAIA